MAYERLLNLDLQSRFIKAERRDLDSIFKMEFSSSTNYFSPIDAFCSNKCILLSKGEPTMFDRDHFLRARRGVDGRQNFIQQAAVH